MRLAINTISTIGNQNARQGATLIVCKFATAVAKSSFAAMVGHMCDALMRDVVCPVVWTVTTAGSGRSLELALLAVDGNGRSYEACRCPGRRTTMRRPAVG